MKFELTMTWKEFLSLPVQSRQKKMEELKGVGYGILKLAKVWGVSANAINKTLMVDVSTITEETIPDRLEAIATQLPDGVSKLLVELALKLYDYDQLANELEKSQKISAKLQQQNQEIIRENQELKADMDAILIIKSKYGGSIHDRDCG